MKTAITLLLVLLESIARLEASEGMAALVIRSNNARIWVTEKGGRGPLLDSQREVVAKSFVWIEKGSSADVFFYGKAESVRSPSSFLNLLPFFNPFRPTPVKAAAPLQDPCSGKSSRERGRYTFQGPINVSVNDDSLSWDGTCTEFNRNGTGPTRGLFSLVHAAIHQGPDQLTDALKDARDAEIAGKPELAIAIYGKLAPHYPGASAWIDRRISLLQKRRDRVPGMVSQRRRALVIGISEYQWLQKGDYIPSARNDANLFYQYLISQRGGGPENVEVLLDKDATAEAIRLALRQIADEIVNGETFYLYMAAHSVPISRYDAALVAYDSRPDVSATTLPFSEIADLLREIQYLGGDVFLFADICHAGLLNNRNPASQRLLTVAREARFSGLVSSKGTEASFEQAGLSGDNHSHGVFTFSLVSALKGECAPISEKLTLGQVKECVTRRIDTYAADRDKPSQTPVPLGDEQTVLADLTIPCSIDDSKLPRGQGPLSSTAEMLEKAEALLKEPRRGDYAWLREADMWSAKLERGGEQTILKYIAGEDYELKAADFTDAAKLFGTAAKLRPADVSLTIRRDFCLSRAILFENKSRASFKQAFDLLNSSIAFDPSLSYLYNARGIARLELIAIASDQTAEDIRRAQSDFETAILLDPFWAYPRHNLALARKFEADGPAAESAYRDAIEWAKYYGLGSGYLYHNLGVLYSREQRWEEARNEFNAAAAEYRAARYRFVSRVGRAAFDRQPDLQDWAMSRAKYMKRAEAEAINALGTTYAVSGAYKRAAQEFRNALQTDANSTEIHRNLGLVLLKQANSEAEFEKAREQLAELAARGSQDEIETLEIRSERDLGECSLEQARFAEKHRADAKKYFEQAANHFRFVLQRRPGDPQALEGLNQAVGSRR
jgi:Tfp pilus assembly protein PilF